jgi:hypothetical protein
MASISDLYNAQFAGVQFLERYEGGWSPADAQRELAYSVIQIPGSDTNIVQRSGKKLRELTIPIAANIDEMNLLADGIDIDDTLIYSRGTVSARLVAVTDRVRAGNLEIENAILRFILS